MKIKNGFVSNSSTSSFVIIGFEVTDEIKEIFENHSKENNLNVFDSDGEFNDYKFIESFDLEAHYQEDKTFYGESLAYVDYEEGYIGHERSNVIGLMEKFNHLLEIINRTPTILEIITGDSEP